MALNTTTTTVVPGADSADYKSRMKRQQEQNHKKIAGDLRKINADLNTLITELQRFPHAIGEPVPLLHTETPPDKTIELDGAALSKTTFPELFAVWGYMFGGSDDTFNAPDMRGLVLRGWNNGKSSGLYDKTVSSRLNRGDGTTGDHVGTLQDALILNHRHSGVIRVNQNGQVGAAHPIAIPSVYLALGDNTSQYTDYYGGDDNIMMNISAMWVSRYEW